MRIIRGVLVVTGVAVCAAPLAAQRGIIVRAMGGGYSHTMNLNSGTPYAHFKVGFNLGTGLGVQLNKYLAIQGDFTFGQAIGQGEVDFIGDRVNRYYLTGRVDLRYPLSDRFVPYVFGGAGRVWVDQAGHENNENFQHFNRFAGIFGAGLSFQIPNTNFALLAEGKGHAYKWVAEPFNRNQLDITYSMGVSYRFGF